MKFRATLAILPLLFASACGNSDSGNASAPANSVAAVKAPAGTDWLTTVVKTPEGGMRMGNPDAPIKVIEYGSRACPFCAQFDQEGFPPLKSDYIATGKVSYEFREYPIHGSLDFAPILLGQCTGDTATFFPILDAMFKNQEALLANEQTVAAKVQAQANATPSQVATMFAEGLGYIDFMKQRGLPEAKARACLNDPAGMKRIVDQAQAANDKYQVSSTPTFIVNGDVISLPPGQSPWSVLKAALVQRGA
jgi:protein-disulfide isomerase